MGIPEFGRLHSIDAILAMVSLILDPMISSAQARASTDTLFVSVGSLSSAVGCGLVLPNSRFVLEVMLIVGTFFNLTDRASGYIISISSYDGILNIARVSATTVYSKHDRSKLWYIYGNRN